MDLAAGDFAQGLGAAPLSPLAIRAVAPLDHGGIRRGRWACPGGAGVYPEWFLVGVSRVAARLYVPGMRKLVEGGGQEQGPSQLQIWTPCGLPPL